MSSAANTIVQKVTIADGQTVSSAVDLTRGLLLGIKIPTLAGATLTLQNSPTETGTYSDVYGDDGTIYTITATDGAYIALDSTKTAGLAYVKLVSASAESGGDEIEIYIKQAS